MTEKTTITVRKSDKQVFEQTLDAIAEEIGDRPTRSEALRELSEAYIGRDSLGRWQDE
ncbi:hypothetical protein NDI86_21915 [Halomicroarcula sp. S3CR25-11]|uniref:Ribbon-helix-helix protein CopG domain-containing protein n=1 Tax=Haloarcula onubensis TaxID=2950539 RepID=A0ABU2FVJ6_9EURY|nr:hypothetical protein [Halomicroarcula sp. S3CR25-11]